jgi:hypothetical protein
MKSWSMKSELSETLGWLGTMTILLAYMALGMGVMSQGAYFVVNAFTGAGLAVHFKERGSAPGVFLNAAWGLISLAGAARLGMFR